MPKLKPGTGRPPRWCRARDRRQAGPIRISRSRAFSAAKDLHRRQGPGAGPFAKKIAETEATKDLPALAFSALDMTAINVAQWPQKPSEAAISPT